MTQESTSSGIFETRFLDLPASNLDGVLKLVEEMISAIGQGTATAVSEITGGATRVIGIQVTFPAGALVGLEEVISKYRGKLVQPRAEIPHVLYGYVDHPQMSGATSIVFLRSLGVFTDSVELATYDPSNSQKTKVFVAGPDSLKVEALAALAKLKALDNQFVVQPV